MQKQEQQTIFFESSDIFLALHRYSKS